MVHETELELALQQCREVVSSDSNWTEGLDRLAWAMGADGCSFVNQGPPETRALMPASSRYAEFVKDFVAEGWASNDLRARRAWPQATRPGMVFLEHDVSSEDERETLPVYRDLYVRHDLCWWATVTFGMRSQLWALSFLRSQTAGPFTPADAADMQRLSPLLTGLVDLRVAVARARADDAVRLLAATVGAALVVSEDYEVVSASADALTLLRQERLLTSEGRLAPSLCASLGAAGDGPVVIARHLRHPLLIDRVPGRADADSEIVGRQQVLLLRDLEREVDLDPAILRSTFGLTRAEAALGAHLARGQTLRSSADVLGISVETARNQLRAIFAKTGSHRQPDLVSLMLRMMR